MNTYEQTVVIYLIFCQKSAVGLDLAQNLHLGILGNLNRPGVFQEIQVFQSNRLVPMQKI